MAASTSSASELSAKRALLRCFLGRAATRSLMTGVGAAAVARLIAGRIGLADLLVVAIIAALVGPTEWLIHQSLFHAAGESFRSRRLRTGERHRRHHEEPSDVRWLLLDVRGAVLLMTAVAGLVAAPAAAVALALPGDQAAGGLLLTGLVVGLAALANYEWTHLLIHSRYRPRTKRYRRLARNHLAHHHRDEATWLGVSTNLGDHLFRTTARRP